MRKLLRDIGSADLSAVLAVLPLRFPRILHPRSADDQKSPNVSQKFSEKTIKMNQENHHYLSIWLVVCIRPSLLAGPVPSHSFTTVTPLSLFGGSHHLTKGSSAAQCCFLKLKTAVARCRCACHPCSRGHVNPWCMLHVGAICTPPGW